MKPTINFDDFLKLDLRVGEVLKAEEIPDSDKLWKLTLDVGKEIGRRTICAGIKPYYKKEELKGKKIILLANFINLLPKYMNKIFFIKFKLLCKIKIIAVVIPIVIPIKRSNANIPITVAVKGMSFSAPIL